MFLQFFACYSWLYLSLQFVFKVGTCFFFLLVLFPFLYLNPSFCRCGVGFVVFFTDSIFSSIVKWFRKPIVVEDYLKKYQTDNHKKYGWFVVTIVDAFVATRAAFVRSLVPKEKRY
jgi:hypothetical protein